MEQPDAYHAVLPSARRLLELARASWSKSPRVEWAKSLRVRASGAKDPDEERQLGLVLQDEKTEVKPPPMWRVMIMNDDYTPMEFVVAVLQMFFAMDHDRAYRVMMHVHTRGKGICGVYTKEIAETKVAQVNHFARTHQHPLMCAMEEV
jgi:ATP-dependent Clp protease adaptor protein ClpS